MMWKCGSRGRLVTSLARLAMAISATLGPFAAFAEAEEVH